jgi:hypothetical protein
MHETGIVTASAKWCESAFAPDLRSLMAGRVERCGRDYFATRPRRDLDYAVAGRPPRVIPGGRDAIFEPLLDGPPERALAARPPSPSADRLPLT